MQAATQDLSEPSGRPSLAVDVVMRREPITGAMSRWQTHRWVLADVLPTAEPQRLPVGAAPARPGAPREVEPLPGAQAVDGASYWLFPGHRVELFRDDVEGLFLNLSSPMPCFWVFWRADDEQLLGGEPMAVPQIVTLSYHDAGRWLDAQEKVDQVPAPEAVVEWLRAFVDQHHHAEPKRRKRPDSFKTLTDRFGQPARVSTDKAVRGPREGGRRMTLRIGISARLLHEPPPGLGLPQKRLQFLESSMAHWVMAHGAIALMVPFVDEDSPHLANRVPIGDVVDLLDGLVLQGGIDVCPETYGGELLQPAWAGDPIRDRYELALLRGFIEARKPVLGICRGAQLINVFHGGTLVQDIPSQRQSPVQHQDLTHYDRLQHEVRFEPGLLLDRLYGAALHRVTSIHHQCVDRLGDGLLVEALCPQDGVIEAIRATGPGFVLGLQWHPEFHLLPTEARQGLIDSGPVMEAFLQATRERADRMRKS